MCYFLTIGLPVGHLDDLKQNFGRGYILGGTKNRHLLAAMPQGFEIHLVVTGMCSCDLFRRAETDEQIADDHSRLRTKYLARGWSEAKILRALTQLKSAKKRSGPQWTGLHPDVIERLRRVCDILGRMVVYVHFYNDDIETEQVPVSQSSKCSLEEFAARATTLQNDELLAVKRTS